MDWGINYAFTKCGLSNTEVQILRGQLDPSVEFREEVQVRDMNLGVISIHVAFKGIGLDEVFEEVSIEKRGGPIAEFWDISTFQSQGITGQPAKWRGKIIPPGGVK